MVKGSNSPIFGVTVRQDDVKHPGSNDLVKDKPIRVRPLPCYRVMVFYF
ncbi:MAG: hypothetical protein ACOX6X_06645 [Dethiobacteria bacterium]